MPSGLEKPRYFRQQYAIKDCLSSDQCRRGCHATDRAKSNVVKKIFKSLLARGGLHVVRATNDPVLNELLATYNHLLLGEKGPGVWEQKLSKLSFIANLRDVITEQSITCVLDVGANVGQFGTCLRGLGYTGDIISFEPGASARRSLEICCANDSAWRVLPYAVGAKEETLSLSVFASDTFSSFREPNNSAAANFGEFLEKASQETVEVKTLDSVMPQLFPGGPPCGLLLKTDTQGYDLEVFRGADMTLMTTKAVITEAACELIYEGAPLYPEIFSLLETKGFVPSGFYPTGHRRGSSAMVEFDAVFVRG